MFWSFETNIPCHLYQRKSILKVKEKKSIVINLPLLQQPPSHNQQVRGPAARGRGGRTMHQGDASLSPIPDVPSGDERSDHDGTPKRTREGAKVSAFNAEFRSPSPSLM